MIFDCFPWKLDVDVFQTKKLYEINDYAIDKEYNVNLMNKLDEKQKSFIQQFGVDLMKMEVDYKDYEEVHIKRWAINFLIKGQLLSILKYQKEIYVLDENIEVVDNDDLLTYDCGIGLGVVFKHPHFHYDDEIYKKDYILGSILIMEEDDG